MRLHAKSDIARTLHQRLVGFRLVRLVALSMLFLLAVPALLRGQRAGPEIQNCIPGASLAQRNQCDDTVSQQLKATSRTTELDGGWQLVKTRDPGGGAETISVMHVVDTGKSDFGLAGLSVRCGRPGLDVVLIVLEPLPSTSHPTVILTAGSLRSEFEASVVQSGEALLLPQGASNLAAGDWQKATELSVEIATKPNPVRGIVPIAGLPAALRSLTPNCAFR
jgi:hypothetical protein